AGESVEPHVGEFRDGITFTRYYWQLELDAQMRPTGREIVPGGPTAPSGCRRGRKGTKRGAAEGRDKRSLRMGCGARLSARVDPRGRSSRDRPGAPGRVARARALGARRPGGLRGSLRELRVADGRRPGLVPAVRRRRTGQPHWN